MELTPFEAVIELDDKVQHYKEWIEILELRLKELELSNPDFPMTDSDRREKLLLTKQRIRTHERWIEFAEQDLKHRERERDAMVKEADDNLPKMVEVLEGLLNATGFDKNLLPIKNVARALIKKYKEGISDEEKYYTYRKIAQLNIQFQSMRQV